MLTDSKIRSAKPLTKSNKLTDAQGLYLVISTSCSYLWYYRYSFKGKKSRRLLDAYPLVTLAEAREKRDAARKLLAFGIFPSPPKSRKSVNAFDKNRTFERIARKYTGIY